MVPVGTFQGNFRSKRELYQTMAIEVGAYLPDVNSTTIYFLKDLISKFNHFLSHFDLGGNKKFVKCKNVAYTYVP